MEPWDIYTCDFADAGSHPAVIFTPSRLLQRADIASVNVLFCQTLRGPLKRQLQPGRIILDRADGLDWETICYCQMLHLVPKAALGERRGNVSRERRRQISQELLRLFPFEWS
jgi:mRNA-degrading endonuclease toxin of MazEF toxin-antitoxin module